MDKPHDKIFEEIRQFVNAKFDELKALEIPEEYFQETIDEIDHDLYTLGEEIDYWAENRKADRSRAKIISGRVDCSTWTNADQERAIAAGCERRAAAPKYYQEGVNVDSDTE